MNPPIQEDIRHLSWNATNDCVFEATVTNGVVTQLHFCAPPAKSGDERVCLKSIDEPFLRQLTQILPELYKYVDELRSKNGTFKVDEIKEIV